MPGRRPRSLLLLVFAWVAGACADSGPTERAPALTCTLADAALPRASTDDMRSPGGLIFRDTLDFQLDIRRAMHFPEGDSGPRIEVVTFGEAGGSPSVPGPLLRVRTGTTVLARVCNTLADTVWLIGLGDRDTIAAPPGQRTESAFTLDAPSIRVYRGVTREDTVYRPFGPSATLAGAIVVDGAARRGDRVFVITDWAPEPDGNRFALQVNGGSWPHTERLQYAVGDTARWIVVNASPVEHPMHLHGFHFLVTGRSNASIDSVYGADRNRLAVTELLRPLESMSLEWIPERGGRWLFHCHIATHMDDLQRSFMRGEDPQESMFDDHGDHAQRAMAGLVVGIEVTGETARGLAAGNAVKRERLLVQQRADVYPNGDPGLGYVLERDAEPARDSIVVPGPPIVLTRGEPAEINIVNRTQTHTAVHWHGLEIESYFDGVPGWTGDAGRTTPLIPPGDSFLVRLAPPRAGTFIYHSHADELRQLGSGLFGAVIVVEPGDTIDPTTDHVLLFSMAGPDLDIAPIVVNNGRDPALVLDAGRTHRIRIINITADDLVEMEIHDAQGPLPWRVIALDGADVSPAHREEHPALLATGPGETADVEITPRAGDLRLIVRSFNNFESTIRVR